MRKIFSITHVSLDGIMQAPGGPEEDTSNHFKLGGWAMAFGDEAGGKVIDEVIARDFDLLLGRRTYDIFAGYWPERDDNPIGKAFNRARKYVVTHQLEPLKWEKSQRVGGDVVKEISALKGSEGPELHIWGSSQLLQTLIAADLIDEFQLWVYPVVLGEGKRLFGLGLPPRSFDLIKTKSTPAGVLVNIYQPAGPLRLGDGSA